MNNLQRGILVAGCALGVGLGVGFLVGQNLRGKWRMAGTKDSQVLYNERTGETRNRAFGGWLAPSQVNETVDIAAAMSGEVVREANEERDRARVVAEMVVRAADFNRESALSWKWEFERLVGNLQASGTRIHPFTGTFGFGPTDEAGNIPPHEVGRRYDPERHLLEGELRFGKQ